MSRPTPTVIMSVTDPKTFKAEEVLRSTAIFAVFLEGEPINLRTSHTAINEGPKYKKVSFSNPGHAHNLREKLSKLFKSQKFTVVKLTSGVVVEENGK
jgi:hypothetical protein